ncbi:MAG: hypothetical protein H7841_17220, partial [Magnetospirillum sp. WYHS-4]
PVVIHVVAPEKTHDTYSWLQFDKCSIVIRFLPGAGGNGEMEWRHTATEQNATKVHKANI